MRPQRAAHAAAEGRPLIIMGCPAAAKGRRFSAKRAANACGRSEPHAPGICAKTSNCAVQRTASENTWHAPCMTPASILFLQS